MTRWGVIGVGRAGAARARAIRDDPRSRLVAALGGDPTKVGLDHAVSLEVLLFEVDAVAVCSPTRTHADYVEAALHAGRHVVCEYPVAPTAERARQLFQMRGVNQVLHVEHISLLASSQSVFAERLAGATPTRVRIRVETRERLVSSLHRLIDALGPSGWEPELSRGEHRIEVTTSGGVVALEGRQVTVDDEPVPVEHAPGLFVRDHRVAMSRILDGGASYVSDAQVLDVLERAGRLEGGLDP